MIFVKYFITINLSHIYNSICEIFSMKLGYIWTYFLYLFTSKTKHISPHIQILHIPIQRRIITHQSYRVLAYVITNSRVVISEPVVVEASLIILVLSQLVEGDEVTDAFAVAKVTIDVIVGLPDNSTIAVIRFHRATHIIADDRVAFTVLQLCHRNVRAFLIYLRDKVLYRLFA